MKKEQPAADLATQSAAPLAEQDELASLLGDYAGAGTENVTSDDILLPRLLMLQPTSPLAQDEPFRPGYFANSIDKTNYGSKYNFYIVHYYPSRVYWASDEIGGPIDCSSQDNLTGSQTDAEHGGGVCRKCPHSMWTKGLGGNTPPDCTEFKNFIVVPADNIDNIPLLFSLKRTGLAEAMTLLSAVKYSKLPIFTYQYTISSVKTENDRGTFFTPKLDRGAKVSNVADLRKLISLHDQMKAAQDRIVGPQATDDDLEGEAASSEGSF